MGLFAAGVFGKIEPYWPFCLSRSLACYLRLGKDGFFELRMKKDVKRPDQGRPVTLHGLFKAPNLVDTLCCDAGKELWDALDL